MKNLKRKNSSSNSAISMMIKTSDHRTYYKPPSYQRTTVTTKLSPSTLTSPCLSLVFILLLYTSNLILLTHTQHLQAEQQATPSSRAPNNSSCPKSWTHLAQKCYKFNHSSRDYENSKSKCLNFGARLAVVEDEASKEKDTSTGASSSLLSYLNTEMKSSSKHYYVNLSTDLLNQHKERLRTGFYNSESLSGESLEHLDSETAISDLWLQRDDPSLSSALVNKSDKIDSDSVFMLAFSKSQDRWGIVPVHPSKKISVICERISNEQINHNHPSQPVTTTTNPSPSIASQHQNIEAKRANDVGTQSSSSILTDPRHITISSRYDYQRPKIETISNGNGDRSAESTTITTPLPEPLSMLFREHPQDQSIVLGSTAELRCSRLESEASLTWTFQGKSLPTSNRIKVYPSGTLKIEHVRNTDDGNYTCTINLGGITESKSARLEILERPHQPEYINAELLDKQAPSIRLKWTPGFNGNSPILHYLVEMMTVNSDSLSPNEMNAIMLSNQWEVAKANISADQTSVIITDLKPARKYIFRIKATNRVGTGEPSFPTKSSIEVPVQPPSMPPQNLSGSAKSSTSILLQWLPPPADSQNGALKGYKIRHKLAGYASDSDWYMNEVSDAAQLRFVLDDLIIWQNYEIQIAAENDKGVGPYSSSIKVRTNEGKPDKSPRNVLAEALNSTSIKVSWIPPPPQHINGINQGYKIQIWFDVLHNNLEREFNVPHNTTSPLHSIVVSGLLPYTDYHVSIKCYTNAGDGPSNDDIVVVKTKQDFPEAVSTLEFSDVLDKSLKVIWRPPKRINGELDHYTLEYSETLTPTRRVSKDFRANILEAKITDLTPQTSYTFKIYPYTNVGRGPGKTNETKTSVPPVLPEAPTNLVYSNVGPFSALIQFRPGFDGNASIERWIAEALTPSRNDYASRWQTIYESTNHTQDNFVTVRNLRPFTKYRIRLTPVNVVGPSPAPSEPTAEFQTAQVEPEQPPRDLIIEEVKSTSVFAHWSPLANNFWLGNPVGYNLTWSETNSSIVASHLIKDTRADSFLVKDLEEYTEYTFRVYAVNEAGSSPSSEAVIVTTLEDVPSSGPANVTTHALSSNAIAVDWNPVPRKHRNGIIRGYKIQYQSLKSDSPLQHKTVEDNHSRHVTLNDLKPFTSYHLAVAAFTSVGDGVYSPVLTVQTHEDTPAPPQNLSSPTVSQTSIRILWDPPEYPNGEILGYKVTYHTLTEGTKDIATHELHANERVFKAVNLKPDTHYVFTVTAKTKEGWGQQASILLYTYDSELRANLPFYRESWFVILCASLSFVITIIVTALLLIQTKSYKYKHDTIKSTSQDRLGDAGFSLDDDPDSHYHNNGFSMLSHSGHHRRSNGALSQSTANFTLPKSPPRPHPGSVIYSDEGDDDVFEDVAEKTMAKSTARSSTYDSSGDSLTEKPSEVSSSTAPESESADDEYVNVANKHFVNHYANVNGTLRSQKAWKKSSKTYSSHRTKPKLPQRPAPSVPQVPGEPSSSGSDIPVAGTSGMQQQPSSSNTFYGDSQATYFTSHKPKQSQMHIRDSNDDNNNTDHRDSGSKQPPDNQPTDLLNNHIVNLNGGRIIVDNMAGSRAPLPGFTSFV